MGPELRLLAQSTNVLRGLGVCVQALRPFEREVRRPAANDLTRSHGEQGLRDHRAHHGPALEALRVDLVEAAECRTHLLRLRVAIVGRAGGVLEEDDGVPVLFTDLRRLASRQDGLPGVDPPGHRAFSGAVQCAHLLDDVGSRRRRDEDQHVEVAARVQDRLVVLDDVPPHAQVSHVLPEHRGAEHEDDDQHDDSHDLHPIHSLSVRLLADVERRALEAGVA